MLFATLVLILSAALVCFYFQVTCQKILCRQFDREYYQAVASANRLEFLSVRDSLEGLAGPVSHARLRTMLKCDFLALTYLLKVASNVNPHNSREERFLVLYFRCLFLSLDVRHSLGLGEKKAILNLTSVLQHFANVIGQRVNAVTVGCLPADYLVNF
jgi:hypothetical protein